MNKTIIGAMLAMSVAITGVTGSAIATPTLPDATGQAIVAYMKAENYKSWKLVPGTTMMREGKEPHGTLQNVFANGIASEAFANNTSPMPNGTMVVKESYNTDNSLKNITIMYKKTGYNPEAGDYFWARIGADMQVQAEGKLGGCISCHSPAGNSKKDYILLSPVK